MALTPAQRNRIRVAAARAAREAGQPKAGVAAPRSDTEGRNSAYDMLMAELVQDLRQLSDIASVEGKIDAKRGMIGAFDDHVETVLKAAADTGKAVQDEIVATMMIWRFDIGDFAKGLDIADFVLKFGIALPERYKRTPQTLIAEEVAEAALKAAAVGNPFDVEILQRADALIEGRDVNDIVRAKLKKALGQQFSLLANRLEEGEDGPAGGVRAAREEALAAFRRAFELFDKIGVKKDIERLESALKKDALAPPPIA